MTPRETLEQSRDLARFDDKCRRELAARLTELSNLSEEIGELDQLIRDNSGRGWSTPTAIVERLDQVKQFRAELLERLLSGARK